MAIKTKNVEAGCPTCAASGYFGDHPVANQNPFCPDCSGRGKVTVAEPGSDKCPECNGRGHVENVPCFPCAHTGRIVKSDESRKREEQAATVESLQVVIAELKTQLADLQEKLSAKNGKK